MRGKRKENKSLFLKCDHEIVTLDVSLILIHNDRINGCSLGEFDFCTTSYPPWLSAKQYTIGEFCFVDMYILKEKACSHSDVIVIDNQLFN